MPVKSLMFNIWGMDVSTLKGHVTVEFATEEAAQKLIMLLLHTNNVVGHTTICSSLTSQSKSFLLRGAYSDMILDGLQPSRDSFHRKERARLQDAFILTIKRKQWA